MLSTFGGEEKFDLEARPVWHSFRLNARSHILFLKASRYRGAGRKKSHVCHILRAGKTLNDLTAIAACELNKRWGSEMKLTLVNITTLPEVLTKLNTIHSLHFLF
jgi:hypothetical protein